MKIAVLGGSFNPVHLGHLIAANEVLEKTSCDEIWFMPCYTHPWKTKKKMEKARHRIKMLQIATRGHKNIRVSDMEIELGKKNGGKNYTINTVRELRKRFPEDEFFWVIGSPLVKELGRWKKIDELVKIVRFIVVPMPKFDKTILTDKWLLKSSSLVLSPASIRTNISAKLIRKRFRENHKTDYLMPEKVAEYIEKNNLYS